MTNTKIIDCTTCKYGYKDEQLGIPMCHHPKRFSEDCVDFNMHEEKEIKESEKLMQKGLDVTDFCKPIDPSIAQCIADHSWEMLGEDEKPMNQDENLNGEIKKFIEEYGYEKGEDKLLIAIVARHFAEWQKEQDDKELSDLLTIAHLQGADQMKEQMLKDAVKAFVLPLDKEIWCNELDKFPELKEGEKVKLIIIKENEK